MIQIIVFLILALVYAVCPKGIQMAVLLINIFVPDPVPFLDEFVMALIAIKS